MAFVIYRLGYKLLRNCVFPVLVDHWHRLVFSLFSLFYLLLLQFQGHYSIYDSVDLPVDKILKSKKK